MRLDPKTRHAKFIYRLDDVLGLLCNLVLLSLVAAVAVPRAILRCVLRSPSVEPQRAVFLSSEGHKVAPTRVRSYHFAQNVDRLELPSFVLAYWDEYARLKHFPFPFRRIWEVEKFAYNVVTLLWLLAKGPLIVVEQRPNYGFIVPLYLKLLNGSTVYMDIDDWILDYLVMRPFVRLEVRHMLKFFGLYCDGCIVSSQCLEDRLARDFKTVHILPTYVDHRRFTPLEAERTEGPVIYSWIGTVFQDFTRDNVLFIMEGFAKACDELGETDGLRLDIVGGGDFFSAIEEAATTKYADYPMNVRSWLDPEEMPHYLRSIDVGLYSLVEPSLFQKSKSPTKIFEYYACAKPTVSTSLGEAQRFVREDTGFLADTPEAYGAAMAHLYREPQTRRAMGLAGRDWVERELNMEAACRTLKEIIHPAGGASQGENA